MEWMKGKESQKCQVDSGVIGDMFYSLLDFVDCLQVYILWDSPHLNSMWTGTWMKRKPIVHMSQGSGPRQHCKGPVVETDLSYLRTREMGQCDCEGMRGHRPDLGLGVWLLVKMSKKLLEGFKQRSNMISFAFLNDYSGFYMKRKL